MKCKKCVNEGAKSSVYFLESSSTLMGGYSSWWDEDGVGHVHDPNVTTYVYQCSRGHRFVEKKSWGCPAKDVLEKREVIYT